MLRTANHLIGYKITGSEGELGTCCDVLFSDVDWSVQYLVVDTGKWLPGKRVVLPPLMLSRPDYDSKSIETPLSVKQIEDAPLLNEQDTVSREYERRCYEYFDWPNMAMTGMATGATAVAPYIPLSLARSVEEAGDVHLRSMKEVEGYSISATDGAIGHLEDLIVDDEIWTLRYIVVDTKNWLPGKHVLVSVQWIDTVKWADSEVSVDLDKKSIEASPDFDPSTPINRAYEEQLYDFYGRSIDG